MKNFIRYLLALLILLTIAAAPPVGDSDLEATLARSTVKGYLTCLKLNPDTRSDLIAFYLSDAAAGSAAAQSLQNRQLDNYALVSEGWLDDGSYQLSASLEGEGSLLLAKAQKIGARWKITGLTWGDADNVVSLPEQLEQASTDSSEAVKNPSAVDAQEPVPATTSGQVLSPSKGRAVATVQTLDQPINIRSGPGLNYPVQSILREGETVSISGVSALGTWYQAVRNGEVIGWITSWSRYVSKSPAGADLPLVMAPPLPSGNAIIDSVTGDLGKIVLQSKSGGDFYLVNGDFSPFSKGSKVRYLSSGIDPALSPDGSKIAFTRWDDGGAVWLYDLNSGKEWPILGESKQAKSPAWSPDGSKLVFNYQNGGRLEKESHCYSIRSDGTFRDLPHRAYDIEFKGGKLCFKLPPDPFWRLRQVDVTTGDYTELSSDLYSFAPTWDPLNDWRVVFVAGSRGLQQLDVKRNKHFPFGAADLRDRGSVFSPDGSKVATSYKQHQHWEIYTIDAQSGERSRLTPVKALEESFNSAAPAWSPNGQKIAFVSDRSGEWEFWLMNFDGSSPRPLLPPDIAAQIPVEYNGVDERLISWGK